MMRSIGCAHWLTDDVPEECQDAFEEAVDKIEEQMQCAAFAEKQRARGSDSYYMPDAGWANTYLGVSVSLETPGNE